MAKYGKVLTYEDVEEARKYIGKRCKFGDFLKTLEDKEGKEAPDSSSYMLFLDHIEEDEYQPFFDGSCGWQFCLPIIEDEEPKKGRTSKRGPTGARRHDRDMEQIRNLVKKFNKEKNMNLEESIKGNTKKFIQNVIDHLDNYCEDEQGWLDMEENILNLQKYTRFHSLNEAIRDYVMGGGLDVYYTQVNDTLNELYENTPEEAKKWEKYPDDKKWERYVNIMCLYIPKAFKKKMGRELGKNIPEDASKMNENIVSPSRERNFIKMVSRLEEKNDINNIKKFNLAKIEGHLIEKIMKKRGIRKSRLLDESLKKLKRIEEDTFVSPTPKGLHRMKEDYGWEVPYDRVGELYDEMLEAFGAEELLDSITRAMSTDNLADILAYICRMHDFDSDVFHDEDEDEDESDAMNDFDEINEDD